MTRIVVVFPAPLGPRRPRTSPCSTSKETSEIACVLPKWRLTPTTWTPAVTDAGPLRPVVGRVGAHPFGVAETGRDRRLDREGLGLVGPVHDREAVARRRRRRVDRLVVVGSGEAVQGVAAEVVQPAHEALPREVGPHRLGRVLELEAHRPPFGGPLVEVAPRLVLAEVVEELAHNGIALVRIGRRVAREKDEVAARRAEVGADL